MTIEWYTATVGDLQRESILLVEDGNQCVGVSCLNGFFVAVPPKDISSKFGQIAG